ncbi:MAG: glycosyl hydrolase 108 family protein [Smithella sp.]|jgi:GH24 family phage-related lysozyme (muramidase)
MQKNYQRTLNFIMKWEGAKVTNDPDDHGGLTAKYGLTLKTMKDLNLDMNHDGVVDARDVYLVDAKTVNDAFRRYYWNIIDGDNLPGGIDLIMADIAWNSGPGKARQFQREGCTKSIETLTARRIKFYEYRSTLPNQDKYLRGWKNRANDALEEAKKCEDVA